MTRTARQPTATAALAGLLLAFAGCGGGGGGSPDVGAPPPAPAPITKAQLESASKLMSQATFGMPWSALEPAARQGPAAWIEAQFALPVTRHSPTIVEIVQRREAGEFDAFEEDIEYLIFARRLAWWHHTVTAPDQLRQRVAFALSQVFVVSDGVDVLQVYPLALGSYYDLLLDNAFGNFRDLLRDVTLSPAMGVYLSHLNNAKSDPLNNTFPDENYAREVMQLFSIGLFELNADGSRRLDADGLPIPTYDNDDIREFAKIFTGLSFDGDNAFFGNQFSPRFDLPMRMFDAAHEPGEKRLLNGQVVPAGLSGAQDLELAIDNLFNHPNVGPFIGKLLIQRLTTSNPSPAYVERVAAAFADNGQGVRGDMQQVIRAILLDPEAQAPAGSNAVYGKLREPVVRYAALLRQFGATSDDGFIAALGYFLQEVTRQHPLSAPSVFNFYLPDHAPAGDISDRGLVAPEFQITDTNSVVGWPNFVDAVLLGDFVTDAPQGFAPVRLDLSEWEALASDPVALVDRLETLVSYGTMDAQTRAIILAAVEEIDEPALRTKMALYWFLTVPATAVRN